MITIINRGPFTDDPGGVRNYELKINDRTICWFWHKRSDGLAECLRKAADAADAVEQLGKSDKRA